MVLAPLEESSFAYFSNAMNKENTVFRKNTDSHDTLVRTFRFLLHDLIICGLVVCVFGIPYSRMAVSIYGGEMLVQNGGAILLAAYAAYILVTAVNGVTECFAFASMNSKEVFSHGGFLALSALAHLSLSFALCSWLGPVGFILANGISMVLRIGYSWRHITGYLGVQTPSVLDVLPRLSTVLLMVFVLFAAGFSFLLFGMTPGLSYTLTHLCVGGALFCLLGWNVYHEEQLFHFFLNQKKTE